MTDDSEAPPTVGKVVGENLKAIRQSRRLTQGDLADRLFRTGLKWKRTHISDLESGRREAVDLGALVVLSHALELQLRDLFDGEGNVMITPRSDFPASWAQTTRAELRAWLSAEESSVIPMGSDNVRAVLKDFNRRGRSIPIAADRAFAERYGVDLLDVVNAAEQIWDGSLTEERDRRVNALGDLPVGERQAKQGHITRQLTATLTKWMRLDATSDEA
ncbi:helix-turn-helix domain-containing protein [Streptomyces sp. H27-S2]|uniref:helix-turn-helix domain-containing protein n=1 Tax=Streptomyces antarcticus TaxID=2996458 RepID=UPI002270C1B6|nr:helix-turn-helix transcriptional regulator [Streptomyces sp. H27-S2]MCY0952087.1 helix-turn-helix transcriptional regulator [Streptomyces sp. H27-S2]